ncbi:MAG TPA: tetratricopeptide repeat protein [Pyrinomonadaceae bacterium]|jgi:tetratricopeptide (TPR) repeat protein|nr:tetratricopeptide repeat protein [Pyrinomonadaceae bacterium]
MRQPLTLISFVFLLLVFQSQEDPIRKHYEAAEAARSAGNLEAAESEYTAILAAGYQRLGKIYSAQSDQLRAISVLESAQRYQPDSPELLTDLAIAYFNAQQYEKAVVPAAKALAIAPANAGAHQMLGKTYFMLGDLGKSISELETAAKLTPDDIDVAYTLGIAYLRNRQPVQAKQRYDELIKVLGEQPQLHVIIGRAYRQSGLLQAAAEEFRKAIALDPRFPRAHYYLGMTYLLDEDQKKLADALEEFKIEVSANPDEFIGNYYLGVVYNFQRQWKLALPVLQKASAIQPNNPDPYFQLGQTYQELNNHEQAIEVLKKAIALNPNLAHNKGQVTSAHHRLAQSFLRTGQTEAGNRELQISSELKAQAFKLEQQTQTDGATTAAGVSASAKELLELGPEDRGSGPGRDLDPKTKEELQGREIFYKKVIGTAHNNIGSLRGEHQDYLGAAEQFALAAEWYPQQDRLNYNLGLAYYKAQSYRHAAVPLESELKAQQENRPAAILLGMTMFRLHDYDRASELLGGATGSSPTDIETYYALGSSLIRQRKFSAAEPVLAQIKQIKDDAPQISLLLAEQYDANGDRNKALTELNRVAVSDSNALTAHYYAGLLFLKLDKRKEAIKEFEKELALNPGDISNKYALGELLLGADNQERGFALLREIVHERPDLGEVQYTLGKALLKSGDIAGAIDSFERASTLEPEDPDIHYDLGQAYIAGGRKSEGKTQIDLAKKIRSRNQSSTNAK